MELRRALPLLLALLAGCGKELAAARAEAATSLGRHDCAGYAAAAARLAPFKAEEAAVDRAFALGLLATECGEADQAVEVTRLLGTMEKEGRLRGRAAAARGLAHLAAGAPGSAILGVGAALGSEPTHAELLFVRARIERASGQEANALQSIREALAADPALLPARADLGLLLTGRDPKGAREALEAVLAKVPDHPVALRGLGRLAADGVIAGPELRAPLERAFSAAVAANDATACRVGLAVVRATTEDRPAHLAALVAAGHAPGAPLSCRLDVARLLLRTARAPEAAELLTAAAPELASTDVAQRLVAARLALLAGLPEAALIALGFGGDAAADVKKLEAGPGGASAIGLGAEAAARLDRPSAGALAARAAVWARRDPDARRGLAAFQHAAGKGPAAAAELSQLLDVPGLSAEQRVLAGRLALRVASTLPPASTRGLLERVAKSCNSASAGGEDGTALACAQLARERLGDATGAAALTSQLQRLHPTPAPAAP